jgi:hypothetical protein
MKYLMMLLSVCILSLAANGAYARNNWQPRGGFGEGSHMSQFSHRSFHNEYRSRGNGYWNPVFCYDDNGFTIPCPLPFLDDGN